MIVGALIFCVVFLLALFVMALFRGARIVRGADAYLDDNDHLSGELADRVDAWRRHVDEAMHLANSDTCVMCEFDANRRKDDA